jgi:hypothetical protein
LTALTSANPIPSCWRQVIKAGCRSKHSPRIDIIVNN